MSYQATVFNIMIASPSDVDEERHIIRNVILDWNNLNSMKDKKVLLPVSWDTHAFPSSGNRPQEFINKQVLAISDMVVAIFGNRLGTPTDKDISGTVEEINECFASDKQVMIYISDKPVRPSAIEIEQRISLETYLNTITHKALIERFESGQSLRDNFYRQLSQKIDNEPYFQQNTIGNSFALKVSSSIPQLSIELLKSAKDIGNIRVLGGLIKSYHAGPRGFVFGQDKRKQAELDDAFEYLKQKKMIKKNDRDKLQYDITPAGYDVIDSN